MTLAWTGSARGPAALLLGPGPWDAFAPGLGATGYRVLRTDDPAAAMADAAAPEEATLIAHGAGAPAATAWAAAHPDRVVRLILLAPEGVVPRAAPPAEPPPREGGLLARLPLVRALMARAAPEPPAPPPPPPDPEADHRALGREGVPVVALWAGRDEVVPLRGLGVLASWNRAAKQEVVEGAGHDLLATHAAALLDTLRGVLRED